MEKVKEPSAIIPKQEEGTQKDIVHTVRTADLNDARRLFMIARNRLVEVNHWHKFSTPAHFYLTDRDGDEVDRTAEKGDYFKIDIKGPGSSEGSGFDWVFIESIDDHSNPEGNEEHLAMRVRPAANPTERGNDTAHFFTDEATSSFIVMRKGNEVTASVHGRNEIPNTTTSNLLDNVRNTIVAASAIAGLSNIQWRSLVQGLISVK